MKTQSQSIHNDKGSVKGKTMGTVFESKVHSNIKVYLILSIVGVAHMECGYLKPNMRASPTTVLAYILLYELIGLGSERHT
jgi:hypothetical protein